MNPKHLSIGLMVIVGLLVLYTATLTNQMSMEEKMDDAFESPISSFKKYDITRYATAPSHETKILNILKKMPKMRSPVDVERYIKRKFPKSPLTGEMVTRSATRHGVSVYLLLAIMQQDSGLGTTGKGARSRNPGNVGTYGGKVRVYPTWQKGVEAVAKWLKKHKKKKAGTQACRPSSFLFNQNPHKIFFTIFKRHVFFNFNIFF
jgi:hypothetical protein